MKREELYSIAEPDYPTISLSQPSECPLCGAQFGQLWGDIVAELVSNTEVGRHMIDEHKRNIEEISGMLAIKSIKV